MKNHKYIKQVFLIALLILTTLFLKGQDSESTENNDKKLFLKIGFAYNAQDRNPESDYNHPNKNQIMLSTISQLGYYLKPSIIAGVKFGFSHFEYSHMDIDPNLLLYGGTLTYGMFFRHENMLFTHEKLLYFIDLNVDIEQDMSLYDVGLDVHNNTKKIPITFHRQSANTTVGIAYLFGENIRAEMTFFTFDYSRYKDKDDKFTTSYLRFHYNIIQPNIGLSFKF